jgi:hypothetical protein
MAYIAEGVEGRDPHKCPKCLNTWPCRFEECKEREYLCIPCKILLKKWRLVVANGDPE